MNLQVAYTTRAENLSECGFSDESRTNLGGPPMQEKLVTFLFHITSSLDYENISSLIRLRTLITEFSKSCLPCNILQFYLLM
jgi:hypothetical protein